MIMSRGKGKGKGSGKNKGQKRRRGDADVASHARRVRARKAQKSALRRGVLPSEEELEEEGGVSTEAKSRAQLLRMKITATLYEALPVYGAMGGVPKENKTRSGRMTVDGVTYDELKWTFRNVANVSVAGDRPATARSVFLEEKLHEQLRTVAAKTTSKGKGKGKGKGKKVVVTPEGGVDMKQLRASVSAAWKETPVSVRKTYEEKAIEANEKAATAPPTSIMLKFRSKDVKNVLAKKVLLRKLWPTPTERVSNAYLGPSGLVVACASLERVVFEYDIESAELKVSWTSTTKLQHA